MHLYLDVRDWTADRLNCSAKKGKSTQDNASDHMTAALGGGSAKCIMYHVSSCMPSATEERIATKSAGTESIL